MGGGVATTTHGGGIVVGGGGMKVTSNNTSVASTTSSSKENTQGKFLFNLFVISILIIFIFRVLDQRILKASFPLHAVR